MAWPAVYGLNSASFDPRSRQRTTQPTIVLVHDAFHSPIHLERLARELQDNGHRVLVPHLPSSLTTYQPNILEADVQALCEVGRPELDSGRDIVLVLHGYAGIPGSTAAERLNQYALRRPRAGFVAHIVFIAAVVANAGECFLDVLRPQWLLQENGHLRARSPDLVFFQDCSFEDTRAAVSAMTLQFADSFRSRVATPGWTRIPCVYVVCEVDQAIPLTKQQVCVQKLRASNRRVAVVAFRCGHSPFLSRTREISALIISTTNAT